MRVLVTGGTGFIGSRLVEKLRARGDEVVVTTRSSTSEKNGVRYLQWDPLRDGEWTEEVSHVDAVVSLAGKGIMDGRWSACFLSACRESRVVPTSLIAKAIAKSKTPPKVFLSASAVGYYGMRKDSAELDESSPAGTDVLAKMCVEWEEAANPAREFTRVVHPRIGLVLGHGGGPLPKMLSAFRAFVGGPLGDGSQYFPWIHVCDAVYALLYALDGDAIKGPFNVTAPKSVTMATFAEELGRALGRPSSLRMPEFMLRMVLGAQAQALVTGQRVIPKALNDARFPFMFPELRCALGNLIPGSKESAMVA